MLGLIDGDHNFEDTDTCDEEDDEYRERCIFVLFLCTFSMYRLITLTYTLTLTLTYTLTLTLIPTEF